MIVRDNGGIHPCREVQTFVWLNRSRLDLRRLPPYAPEPNPDEGVGDVLKNDRLANYCPTGLDELEATVTAELRRLRRRPEDVVSAVL
ncbi:MAG: transposase [Thermoplasmata archaeon]|nr:transposase [Thermoplasmata archaeon]